MLPEEKMVKENGAKKFYRPLRLGKITEFKVMNAISEHSVQNDKIVSISNYMPQIDIDAVDLVLRVESNINISFIQIQIKTGTKPSKKHLTEIKQMKQKNAILWYVFCPKNATQLSDMLCVWGETDKQSGTLLEAINQLGGAGEGT